MKIIPITICFLILISNAFSQDLGIIHVKGLNGLDISGFTTTNGNGIRTGYYYFFGKKVFTNIEYSFEKGRVELTQFEIHALNLQGSYLLSNPFRNFYINTYIKNSIEFEKLYIDELSMQEESFAFHSGIGLLNEYYINSKFALLFFADQMLIGKSNLGNQYWSAGIGIRIVFNNFSNQHYQK